MNRRRDALTELLGPVLLIGIVAFLTSRTTSDASRPRLFNVNGSLTS